MCVRVVCVCVSVFLVACAVAFACVLCARPGRRPSRLRPRPPVVVLSSGVTSLFARMISSMGARVSSRPASQGSPRVVILASRPSSCSLGALAFGVATDEQLMAVDTRVRPRRSLVHQQTHLGFEVDSSQ